VELLRIDQYIKIGLQVISRKRGEGVERLSRAVRVGLAIEELGPNFSKPRSDQQSHFLFHYHRLSLFAVEK
jgi:hypothetical protein